MTTVERLDEWKALGILNEAQHASLRALVLRQRMVDDWTKSA